jgi:hypothetical protein
MLDRTHEQKERIGTILDQLTEDFDNLVLFFEEQLHIENDEVEELGSSEAYDKLSEIFDELEFEEIESKFEEFASENL